VAALVPIAGTYENPVSTFADRDLNHLFNIFEVIRPWLPFEALGWLVSRIQSPRLGAALVQKVGAGGANITPELMQPHVDRIKDANFAVMFRVISEMRDHSAADLLEDLDVPLLVCAGGADTFTPPSIQKRMVELAPNAELALWDDATHFLPVDKTDEVVERIHTFLAKRVSQTNV
jgi:pimeloyl-ACP methyl ester carboxylesterase